MPVYRTDDGTKWGSGLGRNLTASEVDGNIYELRTAINNVIANAPQPNEIVSITLTGSSLYIHMLDGTQFGPLDLPILKFRWRDLWVANTAYSQLDVFKVDNYGIFLVRLDHTSGVTFDPNADDGHGNLLYDSLFGLAGLTLEELGDVAVTSILDGDVLTWNTAAGKWENKLSALLPTIGSGHVLGNPAGTSAVAADATLTAILDAALGSVEGNIIQRGATVWQVLAPGTVNQLLKSGGSAALNSWAGLSALLDTVAGSTRGALLERGSAGWAVLAPGSANTILTAAGAGADPAYTGLSALIDAVISSTRGSILYRGASGWAALAPGTSGNVLRTNGAGVDPTWGAAAASGSVLPLTVPQTNSTTGPLLVNDAVGQTIGVPLP